MVKLIVAKARNNAIGKDNDLIWRLPEDMRFFTRMTTGHVVIMGRRNWDSIPDKYRPLSNRVNVVVTRNADFDPEDECVVFSSIEEAVIYYLEKGDRDIYIIGGGQVYEYALNKGLVDEMYVTHVDAELEGDTFFPEIDLETWEVAHIDSKETDEQHDYRFDIYHYRKKTKGGTE